MGNRLGHACSDVVSCGLENNINQMARLTDLELDVKEPQWTWAQFPSGETPENPQCDAISQ